MKGAKFIISGGNHVKVSWFIRALFCLFLDLLKIKSQSEARGMWTRLNPNQESDVPDLPWTRKPLGSHSPRPNKKMHKYKSNILLCSSQLSRKQGRILKRSAQFCCSSYQNILWSFDSWQLISWSILSPRVIQPFPATTQGWHAQHNPSASSSLVQFHREDSAQFTVLYIPAPGAKEGDGFAIIWKAASSLISTKTGRLTSPWQAGVLRKYLMIFFTLFENKPWLLNERREKNK